MYIYDVVFSLWRGTLCPPSSPQSEGRGGGGRPCHWQRDLSLSKVNRPLSKTTSSMLRQLFRQWKLILFDFFLSAGLRWTLTSRVVSLASGEESSASCPGPVISRTTWVTSNRTAREMKRAFLTVLVTTTSRLDPGFVVSMMDSVPWHLKVDAW